MKIRLSSRILFILGFILLVATNILVLSGVAINRSGEPDCQVTLTERELNLPIKKNKENSGLTLKLQWRALGEFNASRYYQYNRRPFWFNAAKLEELGFNINKIKRSKGNNRRVVSIPKEVFIVLEYNGGSYNEAVKRAEAFLEKKETLFNSNPGDERLRKDHKIAQDQLERERRANSRLFVIDAGLEADRLREKYSDRTRFIIAKGLVKPMSDYNKKSVAGFISKLSISSINVPLEHRKIFESIPARNRYNNGIQKSPRFEATLIYGSRLEPWIKSVKSLADITFLHK